MEHRSSHGPLRSMRTSAQGITQIASRRADDRVRHGHALREVVPREAHGEWMPPSDRPHPARSMRGPVLDLRVAPSSQRGDVAQSALEFFVTTPEIMGHDLMSSPVTGIQVQLCGNCHAANFASRLLPSRTQVFGLVDFDDTLPGPWEWDVKRLGTSFNLVARNNGLSTGCARDAVRSLVHSYRQHMIDFSAMRTLDVWKTQVPSDEAIRFGSPGHPTGRRGGRHISKDPTSLYTRVEVVKGSRRIAESPPTITRIESRELADELSRAFHTFRESISGAQRYLLEQYRLVDSVRMMVGASCGSGESFIWLLEGMDVLDTVFLQLTAAGPSSLEPCLGTSSYTNHGERVVDGHLRMQGESDPFLAYFQSEEGKDYYVRDAQAVYRRPRLEAMGASELVHYADACGWALAAAHARSGDRVQIAAYLGEGKTFDRAIADFAERYADQVERDYQALIELHLNPHALAHVAEAELVSTLGA